jgi:hypothetical protein
MIGFIILFSSLISTAFGQELSQDAPLEAIRPRSTPIELKPDPPPPPKMAPRKRMVPTNPAVAPNVVNTQTTHRKVIRKQESTSTTTSVPVEVAPAPMPVRRRVIREVPPPAVSETPPSQDIEAPSRVAPVQTAPVSVPVRRVRKVVTETPAPIRHAEVTERTAKSGRKRALSNFRIANIWAVRGTTNSGSFLLGWDPVLFPYKRFNFGLSLGATKFESEALPGHATESFFVYEYGFATSYYMSRTFLPELVIGAQTWKESEKATTNLLVLANANFMFRKRPLGGNLDRIYGGYGMLATSGGMTNIIRVGIGFRF